MHHSPPPDTPERPGVPAAATFTIPWLEGSLLAHLRRMPVLDLKAPADPDQGPVVPGAVVETVSRHGEIAASEDIQDLLFTGIFARYSLDAYADYQGALAFWFERLQPGGRLVIIANGTTSTPPGGDINQAPPGITEEPQARPAKVKRVLSLTGFPTDPAQLTACLNASLRAGSFKILQCDTAPARTAEGWPDDFRQDIRLVIGKQAEPLPAAAPPVPAVNALTGRAVADISIPFTHIAPHPLKTPGLRAEDGLLIRDFAPAPAGIGRIVVLKLDHHGDFIIALPAFRALRAAYPQAEIRLICGHWNVPSAQATGLFDDIRAFNFFPERASEWTGDPRSVDWKAFAAAAEGYFDLAIDLRVDEDTRDLLARIDAGQRCGIGTTARFPLLDIALPDGSREPKIIPVSAQSAFWTMSEGSQVLPLEGFESIMEVKTPLHHEESFAPGARILARSGLFALPEGEYCAEFLLSTRSFVPGPWSVGVDIFVGDSSGQVVAKKVFGRKTLSSVDRRLATLRFRSAGKPNFYEFFLKSEGRSLAGRIRFGGLRLRRLDANGARFSPSELHVGEKLSLLVNLIAQRTLTLRNPVPAPAAAGAGAKKHGTAIVLAPFSNSTIRDWPVDYYAELIRRIAADGCAITLIGSPAQMPDAARLLSLVTATSPNANILNLVGKTAWSAIPGILQSSDLVICNNSGVAHQAASLGATTLALYSASHQPMEWGPRGDHARALMASVSCSPCGFERIEDCLHDHLCMRLLTPDAVYRQAQTLLAAGRGKALPPPQGENASHSG